MPEAGSEASLRQFFFEFFGFFGFRGGFLLRPVLVLDPRAHIAGFSAIR